MKNKKKLIVLFAIIILIVICVIWVLASPRKISFDKGNVVYIGATNIVKTVEKDVGGTVIKRLSTDYNIYDEKAIREITELVSSVTYRSTLIFGNIIVENEALSLEMYGDFNVRLLSLKVFSDSDYFEVNGRKFKLIEGEEANLHFVLKNLLESHA